MGMRFKRLSSTWNKGVRSVDWWLSGGISPANCVAAYQPKGAASYAASKVNLANPGTYNATEGTAPDWDTGTGWLFVIANEDYLDTGYTPSSLDESAFVRYELSSPGTNLNTLIGTFTAAASWQWLAPDGNSNTTRIHNGNASIVSITGNSSGVLGFAGLNGYFNGSDVCDIPAGGSASTQSYYIGKDHGGSAYHLGGYISALAIYNTTITGDQVTALTTAMNAL